MLRFSDTLIAVLVDNIHDTCGSSGELEDLDGACRLVELANPTEAPHWPKSMIGEASGVGRVFFQILVFMGLDLLVLTATIYMRVRCTRFSCSSGSC